MTRFLAPVCWLIVCLVVLALASSAGAQPTAEFWEELGGSASGDGLSASTVGLPTGNRHVSVAIGPDGRPVVAYADGDIIRVRRWTGTAWEAIGPSGASGGLPQIVTDVNGRMYLAWRQFASTLSSEVFLLARDWNGTVWQALGTSASGGGISGAEGAAGVPAFSLALDAAGTPWVAYQTATLRWGDFTNRVADLDLGTQQIYVRRWTGATWEFVGSDRQGGGASNALSFRVDEPGRTTTFASHSAEHPALAIGHDGRPIVAFIYSSMFSGGNPPEFNGENDDMYAVRWNGTAWEPLGPSLPTAPVGPGLGAPGGISNTPGWVREVGFDRLVRPSVIVDHDGSPVLAWGETVWQESPETDGFRRIHVHRWNGTAWQGLGSPSGEIDLISYAYDTSLALGTTGPILAWPRGGGDLSWIAVLAFDTAQGRWRELGQGSVGPGISAPGDRAFNPRVAVNSAGVPTVAWIDLTPSVPQAYLRRFEQQLLPDLAFTSVTAPATTGPGASFGVTAVVRNGGNLAAGPSQVQLYLAAGPARGSTDVPLGAMNVGGLAAGESATVALTVTVPASTAPGSYRIIAVADAAGAVEELNELNNERPSGALVVEPPPAPDVDITALAAPATAQAGGSLVVQHTLVNAGDLASGAISLQFFLSTDDTLGGDVLLGTRTLGSLAAGASSSLETTLALPANTAAPAAYRVIALATLTQQTDRDPGNNGAVSGPVNVTPPAMPDLTVTDITVPATVAVGRPLAVGHTVRNVGPLPTGGFTVRFHLSRDATVDVGDTLLGSRTIGGLAAGGADTLVSTFTVPAGTTTGTYRVLVVADALAQQNEQAETNNVGVSSPTAVTLIGPDLTMTALTVPAGGAAGRPLAITNTVRNGGTGAAGAFTIRFYLSGDTTPEPGDVLLGARSLGGLAIGASSTAVTTLTIPAATPVPSSYHVIAVADALNQQTETDEANNALASTSAVALVAYRPDLSLTALTVPAAGAAGRPLAITNTVRNTGVAPAGAFTVRFFLSGDATLDQSDVLLGARTIGGLAPGGVSTVVTTLTIPATTPVPADYHVIGVVDALNQQTELNETDNTRTSTAAVSIGPYRPDLTLTTLTIPATGATGRPLAITSAVRNTGVAPAGAFTVRLFLSSDDTLHPSDVLLGARMIAALGVGVTSTAVTTVTIPPATTPASYRVIAVVDALEQQAELSEANNALASAGTVTISLYRPELSVTTLTVPAAGAIGRPLAITHAVRNAGPAPAGAFSVRFYLSGDDTLDIGDVLLGSRAVGSLGAGVMSAAVTSVTIPATTTAPAGYHVIAAVDAAGQQTELDETNNARASAGMVAINPYRPELGVTGLTVPAAGAIGRPLAITNAVRNAGPAPAGAFTVRFYLSADDTLSGSDVLLGARGVAALGAGVTSQAVTTVTIPATTAPATYRVIAVVDALEQQTDLTETNNTALSTGTVAVTLFRPDLTVTMLTTPASGTAGRPLAITSAVRNAGPAPAGAFTVRFYLSDDDTLDGTDVLLGARAVASLGAGVTSSAVSSVTVPAATAPASYRIIAVVDALEQQAELVETNNTQMLTGTVAIGGASLSHLKAPSASRAMMPWTPELSVGPPPGTAAA